MTWNSAFWCFFFFGDWAGGKYSMNINEAVIIIQNYFFSRFSWSLFVSLLLTVDWNCFLITLLGTLCYCMVNKLNQIVWPLIVPLTSDWTLDIRNVKQCNCHDNRLDDIHAKNRFFIFDIPMTNGKMNIELKKIKEINWETIVGGWWFSNSLLCTYRQALFQHHQRNCSKRRIQTIVISIRFLAVSAPYVYINRTSEANIYGVEIVCVCVMCIADKRNE